MSSVGLMMLQEPRVRPPGPRKRRSIFSRPSAMSAASRPPLPNLPPTIPDVDEEEIQPASKPTSRPATQSSDRPGTSLGGALLSRKKTESSDKSSSRNSIFGGRKNSVGESSIKSGTSSHTSQSQLSGAVSNNSREQFSTQGDHSDQVGQQPIAIRFQVKNGRKKGKETRSDSVDNVSVQNHSRDQSRLQDHLPRSDEVSVISYETESSLTATSSRPISPQVEISPEPPSIPVPARFSAFDDAMFKKVATQLEPEPETRQEPPKPPAKDPKRFSTFGARQHQLARDEPISETSAAIYGLPKSYSETDRGVFIVEDSQSVASPSVIAEESALAEESTLAAPVALQELPVSQPMQAPPFLDDEPIEKKAATRLESVSEASPSKSSLQIPTEQTLSPNTITQSARSSAGSSGKSPALSFSSEVRESAIFSDSTWEDDIDYVYEQQAEATCDFDWDFAPRSREQSVQYDSDVVIAEGPFHAHSPSLNGGFGGVGGSNRSSRASNGGSTVSERRHTPRSDQAPRISVGHRGFAAARNSSIPSELSAKGGQTLSPLNVTRDPLQGNKLSPIFAVAADDSPRSPTSPGKLQFPVPPLGRISIDNLSDPESCRDSSKHRKSSSNGSYDSFARTSTAPTSATTSARETGRWSVASGSSAPGLVSSRPKRAPSLSKAMISPPLETLSQNGEDEMSPTSPDNGSIPHTVYPDPERESFVMRRPRTSGDRKVLQAAGRAVQTYRPVPNGTSRAVHSAVEPGNDLSSVAGPGWI